ncbi:porphobilinogen synthase [Candidatus Contubernalis alkaliaceticus]|uniref:porphobilinogen synthase n=1 Tax=Candidatus Contubernalis alkaliaceticus TaxID=338645 RepID=UPI001F4BE0A0|nr:porphobilinogen synthase [Candidatus Contubernalis alkalaceticus]UNC92948.1 porphobilinogen synthase [Candidatus Contubernalis alkalaceticus]
MYFPENRPRRLRVSSSLRQMVRETVVTVEDLIYPLFVVHGRGVKETIPSMPGVFRYSVDCLLEEVREVSALGIKAVLLFGIPAYKDDRGSSAYDPQEVVQRAVKKLKRAFPDLLVITDVCLCEYTSHGHCGLIEEGQILNDATLDLLAETALSHARCGADIVAPSDMMDGRVGAIRESLDREGYQSVNIMSYSVKYASHFYGPFRDAAGSAPSFGDRRTYQMDSANAREALREVQQDESEGADIIMVKPALAYLDIIQKVREETLLPVAAYNVSGEYSMVKAAQEKGWLDGQDIMVEILTSIKRAGADMIITYFARDMAHLLNK